eukprot:680258-Hanusia_phi.AAC.1
MGWIHRSWRWRRHPKVGMACGFGEQASEIPEGEGKKSTAVWEQELQAGQTGMDVVRQGCVDRVGRGRRRGRGDTD